MRLLRPLADRGDPKAQNRIGVMYQRGSGVPPDYTDAVSWFRQAADQGDADAQNNLAFMYLYGRGVSKDYISAYMWFSLAASGGVRSAGFSRDLLAAKMTPVQVAKAQKLAHEWKQTDDRRHLFQLNADRARPAAPGVVIAVPLLVKSRGHAQKLANVFSGARALGKGAGSGALVRGGVNLPPEPSGPRAHRRWAQLG